MTLAVTLTTAAAARADLARGAAAAWRFST
jgi:hypothetical protein